MIHLNIFVEAEYDAAWVEAIVVKAFDRSDLRVTAHACRGKNGVFRQYLTHTGSPIASSPDVPIYVALVDADAPSLADARAQLRHKPGLGQHANHIFFAVPSIESWLFADISAAKSHLRDSSKNSLDRLQFPDEIPLTKTVAIALLGGSKRLPGVGLEIFRAMNIGVAVTRSPSLRDFLSGLAEILGSEQRFEPLADAERLLGRRLLGALIRETTPSSRIIYRTMEGHKVTAEQLSDALTNGTPLARQYAADLLRVARELLAVDAAQETDGLQ